MVHMSKQDIIKMQIKRIEKELRDTPHHKGTDHHIGKLRARLSKLKDDEIQNTKISKGAGGGGYAVKKQGDATVVLVGPPSVGKSTLLNRLTNAKSKIAPYAFTTLTVIPGMMDYNNAKIQILDVPGIIGGAEKGKGRGQEVLSVARGADLIVIITDVEKLDQIEKIKTSLYKNGIRLDMTPPNVVVEKKLRGNIVLHSNIRQDIAGETIKDIAREFGYKNAEIAIKEHLSMDRLIDAFSANRVYIPSITVINKIDQENEVHKIKDQSAIKISAETSFGLENLRDAIWNALGLLRVYLVRREEKPDFSNPIVMRRGKELGQVAIEIGTEFAEGKKMAKIWGNGAKFPGQTVSLNTKAEEGMQVRFI